MAGNIVKHCAPTLAGIKVGNAFSAKCTSKKHANKLVDTWNTRLKVKGIRVALINYKTGRALFYVYRISKLQNVLKIKEVEELLLSYGYTDLSASGCLDFLKTRMRESAGFPHEIGVFLGYPLDDIKAFIINSGKNAICVGCWKVYHDEELARKTFCKYDKCTRIYMQKYKTGVDLLKLTIAG